MMYPTLFALWILVLTGCSYLPTSSDASRSQAQSDQGIRYELDFEIMKLPPPLIRLDFVRDPFLIEPGRNDIKKLTLLQEAGVDCLRGNILIGLQKIEVLHLKYKDNPYLYIVLASCHQQSGNHALARLYLDFAEESYRLVPEIQKLNGGKNWDLVTLNRAILDLSQGDFKSGLDLLEKVESKHPFVSYLQGSVFLQNQNPWVASEYLSKALKAFPRDPHILQLKSFAMIQMLQFEEAKKFTDLIPNIYFKEFDFGETKTILLLGLKDWSEALKIFQNIRSPSDSERFKRYQQLAIILRNVEQTYLSPKN